LKLANRKKSLDSGVDSKNNGDDIDKNKEMEQPEG